MPTYHPCLYNSNLVNLGPGGISRSRQDENGHCFMLGEASRVNGRLTAVELLTKIEILFV